VVSFGVNNYSAARAGMNGFVRGQAVVEGKQAGGGLPFERAVKLQEASEGTDGFFRISKDANLQVQIVETDGEAESSVVRRWPVATESVLQGTHGGAIVHGRAFRHPGR
jgi:hypothetical protein